VTGTRQTDDGRPPERDRSRYVADRPKDVRVTARWHRFSHHTRRLPAVLESLSRDLAVPRDGRVLDYGCADVPYRRFFGPDVGFVAADLPGNPDATLLLEADGTVPLPDGSVDAVLSTQVLEHVGDPAAYLSECLRVCRPGGRLLLSTHGVFIYHPDPIDYWRWTSAGLRHVVETAGFRVVRFEGIVGLLATGIQLVQDAVYWKLPRPLRPVFALLMQTAMAVADRLEGPASRDMNAQTYALVAEKPAE
jgi:SAM-dependent methyltransferase